MASFRGLNLNDGTGILFGYVTEFWGLSGSSPIETQMPSGLFLPKYKSKLQEIYDNNVPSAVSVITNSQQYATVTEANEALDAVATYLINNVFWLWGSLETGGCFMYSEPNTNDVMMVVFCGLYKMESIPANYYVFRTHSCHEYFEVYPNGDTTKPLTGNTMYFFNWSITEENGPVNHVMHSDTELRVVDCRSLGTYAGFDIQTSVLPERWEQQQGYIARYWTEDWQANYLKSYTEDNLSIANPHPWERWFQNRVVPNIQFFVGYTDPAYGELIGTYVPIEKSDAVIPDSRDPSGGGAGGPSGGDGDQDGVGTDVDTGAVPTSGFLQTGISRIYLPTQAQMTDFAQYVFSDITQSAVEQLKKMWSNPLDYVENLGVCRLHGLTSSGTQNISFGGVDTGVPCNFINNAFHEFDYTAHLTEHWNSILDYASYTKLKIFVPYCGVYDLNVDQFMMDSKRGGCTITLRYRIDLMSGMCIAMIRPSKAQYDINYSNLNSFLYQFNGNIYLPLSLTATDWRNTYQSVLSIAGGMIAPSPSSVIGMATDIMGQKVNVQHSGSIGTNFGYMGIQEPYLIVERPAISEPFPRGSYSQRSNYGYPSNKLVQLSSVGGFVKVRKGSLWTLDIRATEDEKSEIIDLLENQGVWID